MNNANITTTTTSSSGSSSGSGTFSAGAPQISASITANSSSAIDTTTGANTTTTSATTIGTVNNTNTDATSANNSLTTPKLSKAALTSSVGSKNGSEDSSNKTSSLQLTRHKLTPSPADSASGSLSSSSSTSSSQAGTSSSSSSSGSSSTSTSPDVGQEIVSNRRLSENNIKNRASSNAAAKTNLTLETVPLATATISAADGLKLKIQTTTSSSSLTGNISSNSVTVDNTSQQAPNVNNKFFTSKSSNSLIDRQNTSLVKNNGRIQSRSSRTSKDQTPSIKRSGDYQSHIGGGSSGTEPKEALATTNGGDHSDIHNMSGQQTTSSSLLNSDGNKTTSHNKGSTLSNTFQPTIQSQQNPPQQQYRSTLSDLPPAQPTSTSAAIADEQNSTAKRQDISATQNQPTISSKILPSPRAPSSSLITSQTTPDKTLTPATSSPVSPAKPKATRARKAPAASNKGANATPSKPEPAKRASKASKAKQAAAVDTPKTAVEPDASQAGSSSQPITANASDNVPKTSTAAPKKRKPRSASNDAATAPGSNSTEPASSSATTTASPPKRSRKKKTEPNKTNDTNNNSATPNIPPANTHHMTSQNPQLLSVASGGLIHMPPDSVMPNAPLPTQPPMPHITHPANRQMPSLSPLDIQHHASQDPTNRYFSLSISPYSSYDYTNAASLTRPSLSRLFTSSSSAGHDLGPLHPATTTAASATASGQLGNQYYQQQLLQHAGSHPSHAQSSDDLTKAFEELRDNTWSHLSKCILDQAQQFDIPSLIGTLYVLRSENEKLVNKVRDLNMKREQLLAINARLDLPGPMLTQHLSHTSPNFSSVVAGLTNSPKSLPNSSPSPAMNKSPLVSGSAYPNHIVQHVPQPPSGSSLGPPGSIDRGSPLVGLGQPHPAGGVSSLKSSSISTPSPPTSALLAHGASNRAGLMTVNNSSYLSSLHPSINVMNQLGSNAPSSSYYPRQ